MYIFLQSILRMTAWPMTPPVPYSAFHILLTLFGAGFAFSFARVFGKKIRSMASPEPYFRHILFSCGVLLALMELYKQAFLYVIEFHGHFDWWYFPFQLCSIPMYICLAAPLLHSEKNTSPRCHLPSGFRAAGWNHGPGCAARTHASVLDDDAPMASSGILLCSSLDFYPVCQASPDMNGGIIWIFFRSFSYAV